MSSSILDQVRQSCRAVAEKGEYVKLDFAMIPEYASSLPLERIFFPEHHPEYHYLGHGADTVAFFLTLDTVNFGSGYFPFLTKRAGLSGYFTIASSLNDYYRKNGPLSAAALAAITMEDCCQVFKQGAISVPVRELMDLFATALRDLGRYVLERFDGSFTAVVDAAGGSAEKLAELLSEMPFYRDVEKYGDLQVPFYKRAQIASADLHIAFDGKGPGKFHDLDRLTIFADNLVPHVLRVDGVLSYDQGLLERIEREELIPIGSPEEVEIRACAVHAVELIVEEWHRHGEQVTAMGIDNLLWHRGQDPYYKSRPRHRTRCVFY